MINKIIPTGLATLIILLAVVFATSADEGDETPAKGLRFSAENREAVMEAVEKCDYDAWYNALTENGNEPPMLEYINEGNFARFCEMHDLRMQAQAIADELGLPKKGMRMGKGGFKGHVQRLELTDEQKAVMEQVRELMQSGDREGAQALMEEAGMPFGKAMSRKSGHWNQNQ
ncbi:hypothetical protein KKA33_01230 [Patescibacteria group bacterium]|nr:hypothetical protein [Patescibacteria group bacterium]